MDGLGLPVCWAACPGPNEGFATDGQRMVTLGGMDDPDGFLGRTARRVHADGGGKPSAGETMELCVASRMLEIGARAWEDFRAACARRDPKAAARILGAPQGAFRGAGGGWEGSVVARMMERVGMLNAKAWDVVRRMALGDTQKRVADLEWVSKQAMSARVNRMARSHGWVRKMMETNQ
jgi:hypothetical protein